MQLKDTDYRIIFELMKNAKISDRKLAKKIGVSQPTITRRRARLEKEAIDGYTAVPNWKTLGYEILAITLIKSMKIFSSKEYDDIRSQGLEWLNKHPNIIMAGACEGMGMNSFIISLHRNYSDHSKFMLKLRLKMGDFIDDLQTYLINLTEKERIKCLHLKYLADAR
jgi:DNA-binding Lrp family transcriptional regulator